MFKKEKINDANYLIEFTQLQKELHEKTRQLDEIQLQLSQITKEKNKLAYEYKLKLQQAIAQLEEKLER